MITLWLCQQFAIEAMAIEIVDFPMKNGGSFHGKMLIYQRVLKDDRITSASIPSTTPHRGAGRKGEWVEPAECPSKSHHCCRCWGGTSATEVRKKGALER